MNRTRFTLSVSLYYAAFFAIIGLYLPYFPLWLEAKGLSPSAISFILALPIIVRVVATPGMSVLADRMSDWRKAIVGFFWATALLMTLYPLTGGFWHVALVACAAAAFWYPLMPITEAFALRGVRMFDLDYGRLRLWGSVSFIAANPAGGAAVDAYGANGAIAAIIAAAFITALSSHTLPPAKRGEGSGPTAGWNVAEPRFMVVVLLGAGLLRSSHATVYAFSSISWADRGTDPAVIGALWAIGVVMEVCLFALSGRALSTFGVRGLMAAAVIGALIRWPAMTLVLQMPLLFGIQGLHALTFSPPRTLP